MILLKIKCIFLVLMELNLNFVICFEKIFLMLIMIMIYFVIFLNYILLLCLVLILCLCDLKGNYIMCDILHFRFLSLYSFLRYCFYFDFEILLFLFLTNLLLFVNSFLLRNLVFYEVC